jgi:hypothetical protein
MGSWRVGLAVGVAATCGIALGCTDGTTPDCSDAQCAVVSVVEAGGDGSVGDAGASDAPQVSEAGVVSDGGPPTGSMSSDATGNGDDAGG